MSFCVFHQTVSKVKFCGLTRNLFIFNSIENIFDIFILKYLIIICRIEISIYFIFYFTSLFAASSAPWLTYLLLDNMENFTTRIPVGFTMPLKISLGLNDPRSLLVNTSLAFEKNANIRVNSGLWLKLKHKKISLFLGLTIYHELILKQYFDIGFFTLYLSLIHIWRCRRYAVCRSRWSPYH